MAPEIFGFWKVQNVVKSYNVAKVQMAPMMVFQGFWVCEKYKKVIKSYNVEKVQMAPMAAEIAATPGSTVRLPCTQPSALRPAITWEKVPALSNKGWPNISMAQYGP